MIPKFKIRCSAISEIMGCVNRPTEKQLALLAELEAKEKRTAKQDETLGDLIARRDSKPELSAGAKSYCKRWLKEQAPFYNRRAEFSNKYTERGIECEPASIELLSEAMNYGMIAKNEQHFYDDEHIIGTPDVLLPGIVEEIKTSWSWQTFPLFETEQPEAKYEYQVQGYMAITPRHRAAISYCLIDTPEQFIDREALMVSRKAGFDEVDMELYDEVRAKMTYGALPLSMRFKRWEYERDNAVIAQIRTQVELCRVYIANELAGPFMKLYDVVMTSKHQDGVTLFELP